MDDVIELLENLTSREKKFLVIFLGSLGVFFGLKFYENFLEPSIKEITTLNSEVIWKKKSEMSAISSKKEALEHDIKEQKLKIQNYQEKIIFFNKSYEDYLKFIQSLSKKYNLTIKTLNDSHHNDKAFQKHRLKIELVGKFTEFLLFILELENANFVFENIELQNVKGLNLELHLMLQFVSLKQIQE